MKSIHILYTFSPQYLSVYLCLYIFLLWWLLSLKIVDLITAQYAPSSPPIVYTDGSMLVPPPLFTTQPSTLPNTISTAVIYSLSPPSTPWHQRQVHALRITFPPTALQTTTLPKCLASPSLPPSLHPLSTSTLTPKALSQAITAP